MRLTPFEVAWLLFMLHLLILIASPVYVLRTASKENTKVSGFYTAEEVIKRVLVVFLIWTLFYFIMHILETYTPYKVLSYWHLLWKIALSETSNSVSAIMPPK